MTSTGGPRRWPRLACAVATRCVITSMACVPRARLVDAHPYSFEAVGDCVIVSGVLRVRRDDGSVEAIRRWWVYRVAGGKVAAAGSHASRGDALRDARDQPARATRQTAARDRRAQGLVCCRVMAERVGDGRHCALLGHETGAWRLCRGRWLRLVDLVVTSVARPPASDLKGAKTWFRHAAARWYSWRSPPSRPRRSIAACGGGGVGGGVASGGWRPSARCGRSVL